MKVAVLTTETTHHAYFVKELKKACSNVVAFCEIETPSFPFKTYHSFEDEREDFELSRWFNSELVKVSDLVETFMVSNMNEASSIQKLKSENADVVIVFGTGKLNSNVIKNSPKNLFNLHGGDPERYRGLDTHLWSIYHRDFPALITTLHKLDENLDTGDLILQSTLPLYPDMPLIELRAVNTEVCVKLVQSALDMIKRHGDVVVRPQRVRGRYYSAMPAELKEVCKKYFSNYVSTQIS